MAYIGGVCCAVRDFGRAKIPVCEIRVSGAGNFRHSRNPAAPPSDGRFPRRFNIPGARYLELNASHIFGAGRSANALAMKFLTFPYRIDISGFHRRFSHGPKVNDTTRG